MAKTFSSKHLSDLMKQGREMLEQVIPDKKLLKKYETLLAKKIEGLAHNEKLEELIKPLRTKLEKSCLKPLEAKNIQEFSQRVVSVVKVRAKKEKKALEKKFGMKKKKTKASPRKRAAAK